MVKTLKFAFRSSKYSRPFASISSGSEKMGRRPGPGIGKREIASSREVGTNILYKVCQVKSTCRKRAEFANRENLVEQKVPLFS